MQKKGKTAKTSFIILLGFVIVYAPFTIKNILIEVDIIIKESFWLQWFTLLAYSNILTDCIIYFLRMTQLRKAAIKLIHRKLGCINK